MTTPLIEHTGGIDPGDAPDLGDLIDLANELGFSLEEFCGGPDEVEEVCELIAG